MVVSHTYSSHSLPVSGGLAASRAVLRAWTPPPEAGPIVAPGSCTTTALMLSLDPMDTSHHIASTTEHHRADIALPLSARYHGGEDMKYDGMHDMHSDVRAIPLFMEVSTISSATSCILDSPPAKISLASSTQSWLDITSHTPSHPRIRTSSDGVLW